MESSYSRSWVWYTWVFPSGPGNSWGYPQSCFSPKPWCLPPNTMPGGAWGLFSLTFSFLLPQNGENPETGDVICSLYYQCFCKFFLWQRKALGSEFPLNAISCHFSNSWQSWSLMPQSQLRLSTSCSQAAFLTSGTVFPDKSMNNK